MGTPKVLKAEPPVELHLVFADSQNWRSPPEHTDIPVFLASQRVLASVQVVYHDASYYRAGDKLQVSLVGTCRVESWVGNHPYGEHWAKKVKNDQILHMRKDFTLDSSLHNRADSTASQRVDFSFQACTRNMPDIRFGSPNLSTSDGLSLGCESKRYTCLRSLPSSTITNFTLSRCRKLNENNYFEVLISYQVDIVLLRESGQTCLARISRKVKILDDSGGRQPPTCVGDFANEYRLSAAVIIHSSRSQRLIEKLHRHSNRVQRLFVSANEPCPLLFRRFTQHATTVVPIALTLLNPDNDNRKIVSRDIEITWRLQQSRFSAVGGLKTIPTHEHVHDPKTNIVWTSIQERKRTYRCSARDWRVGISDDLHSDFKRPASRSTEQYVACSDGSCDDLPQKVSESLDDLAATTREGSRIRSDETAASVQLSAPLEEWSMPDVSIPSGAPTLTTTLPLPISIPSCALKLPTSFTPYMAIRYSLLVYVFIRFRDEELGRNKQHADRDCKGKTCTAEAGLEVPVQLVYANEESDSTTEPSVGGQATNAENLEMNECRNEDVGMFVQGLREELPTYRDSTRSV